MSISYLEQNRQFHLRNDSISYVFRVLEGGELNHLYFGPRLRDDGPLSDLQEILFRDTLSVSDDRGVFSLEQIRQEYPVAGSGDLRPCALTAHDERGSHAIRLSYAGYTITDGKPPLAGLPATYAEHPGEAQTLDVLLRDEQIGLEMTLSYTLFEHAPVIARSMRLTSAGTHDITVEGAFSASLDLPDSDWDMITLTSAWSRECNVERARLRTGLQGVSSLGGRSSQHANPFIALARPNTTESHGDAIGMTLVYSGNFDADVAVDTMSDARMRIGINPDLFSWHLAPGESFQTPEALLAYSRNGLNELSQTFHELLRTRLVRGPWRGRRRPITLNTWEAFYWDIDEEGMLEVARQAADLGIELVVIDDGWFGHRDWNDTSLGDWTPNREKFPNGLKPLSSQLHALGLKFGLWFEPEMVNPDSALYMDHPDWVLGDTTRELSISRHQYPLDLTKDEVRDYLVDAMSRVIGDNDVDYVKWNMNRSLSEVFSDRWPAERQGELQHRYVLGYYDLISRLAKRFPDLLIEGCSGGGGRTDPGILAYAPQTWISENTDAMERVRIQYGTSFVYPLDSMAAHVTPVPNAQTGRVASLKTRGDVAMFGVFGYELDPRTLTDDERRRIRWQIDVVKRFAPLIGNGRLYRLLSPFRRDQMPFDPDDAAWMVVSDNRQEALVGYYRTRTGVNMPVRHLRLQGLRDDLRYAIDEIGFDMPPHRPRYGDELAQVGLALVDGSNCDLHPQIDAGDNLSRIFHLRVCGD